MKLIALFILTFAVRSFAADNARANLQIRDYHVPPSFIAWLGDPEPKEHKRVAGITACYSYKMSLGARGPWPSPASAIYIVSTNRLIVRHTAPFIKALDQLAEQWRRQGGKAPPDPKLLQILHEQCPSSEKP